MAVAVTVSSDTNAKVNTRRRLTALSGILALALLFGCTAQDTPAPDTSAETDAVSAAPIDVHTDEETNAPTADTEAETAEGEDTPLMKNWFSDFVLKPTAEKGISPTADEKNAVLTLVNGYLNDLSTLPCSFKYGNETVNGFGEGWVEQGRVTKQTDESVSVTVTTDYQGTLRAAILLTVYPDYCAYEWTVRFTNIGETDTPIISSLHAADVVFSGKDPVIKGFTGVNTPYEDYETDLAALQSVSYKNETGRPNEGANTYYNLETDMGGVFISIGWPACWSASFKYDAEAGQTRFTAGQRYLTTYLKPGETIRTPLMSFLAYGTRDENRATNLWRHWFIDCNIREIDGETFAPALMSSASWKYSCMENATDANQCQWIRDYKNGGVNLDYFWMDAGWYYRSGTTSVSSWLESGNWDVDKTRFPSGMSLISEYAESVGCKTILWFEPEVVRLRNADLNADGIQPAWILGSDDGNWRLANYGNPEFVEWVTNKVISVLEEGHISVYRQDFGFVSPISVLRSGTDNKRNGRDGITENLYVQGYLQFWDNLIAWNPNLMIDTCASGGNRLDLETLRRSVPLHRTDYDYSNQTQKQAMSQSLFAWLPYFGAVTTGPDASAYTVSEYDLYSSFSPAVVLDYVPNSSMNWDTMSKLCNQWEGIKQYYYKDYYQLTAWSCSDAEWRGWEFFDPETDSGFAQLFRPENAADETYRVKLYGLSDTVRYTVTDTEGRVLASGSGSELMREGFDISLAARQAVLLYVTGK